MRGSLRQKAEGGRGKGKGKRGKGKGQREKVEGIGGRANETGSRRKSGMDLQGRQCLHALINYSERRFDNLAPPRY